MRDIRRRLCLVEARHRPPMTQDAEPWLVDGARAVNRRTGEKCTTAELMARPLPPNTLRIIRNVVDPMRAEP